MRTICKLLFLLLLASAISLCSCVNNTLQTPPAISLDTNYIHSFTKVKIDFVAAAIKGINYHGFQTTTIPGYYLSFSNTDYANSSIKWTGNNFATDTSISWVSHPSPPAYHEDETNGSLSYKYSGTITNAIQGSCVFNYSGYGRNHWGTVYEDGSRSHSLDYNNIPVVTQKNDTLVFFLQGSMLQSYVTNINDNSTDRSTDPNGINTSLQSILWDTLPIPTMKVTFSK